MKVRIMEVLFPSVFMFGAYTEDVLKTHM